MIEFTDVKELLAHGQWVQIGDLRVVEYYDGVFPDGVWHLWAFNNANEFVKHFWGITEYNPRGTTARDRAMRWFRHYGETVNFTSLDEERFALGRVKYIMEARPDASLSKKERRLRWQEIHNARKRIKTIAKNRSHLVWWYRFGHDYSDAAPSAFWCGIA